MKVGISRVKCSTNLDLDLHLFMTIFNYKQCFKNENKTIAFICFLPIYTNPTVEIAIFSIIVRNLCTFVPFLKELNIVLMMIKQTEGHVGGSSKRHVTEISLFIG